MPDEYKDNDYVTAYRNYYKGEKEYFPLNGKKADNNQNGGRNGKN